MYNANEEEKKILAFWDKDKTFEKSVNERSEKKPYVFYDGPPFATGLPHYGHFPSSIMKDAVPRYFTMRGFRVERKWGWDCHGLPIENIVEKELGTKTKKEIEALGVAKFNELCRSKVLGYVDEWKKTINRLGRWVDMDNAYRTMDKGYMESVWWVFKQLWDKELIYQDYRTMHICPRCETTLSQQEVSEGYKDVKDISVFVKFKLKDKPNIYILAWTTTPWTLPGNVALAVNPGIDYVKARVSINAQIQPIGKGTYTVSESQYIYIAKEILEKYEKHPFTGGYMFPNSDEALFSEEVVKGEKLVGEKYEPIFPYYKDTKNAFRVVAGDFVTTEDGTGIVHIAPGFGEDDFQVGKREKIPMVQHVGLDGRFRPEVIDFAGMEVKPRSEDDKERLSADIAVLKYLQDHGSFFAKQNLVHSYPHCWRCDTPLLNYATTSWFVKVTEVKDKALKLAEKINWSPEHIKEGRFGKWLEGARDWSISRQRFWASVMPVWHCEQCKEYVVFGSVEDLEKASGQKIDDLHKHIVDEITVPCKKCKGDMKRIPDVLDTWFDSGSMPYAQVHYPFENKKKFEGSFPAQFIAEGQDQTRAWFYYLHILATSLFNDVAFKNVIVNGIVLAEDGKKMSKKLKNYPDPNLMLEKYGADALRYYLLTSPVMYAESLNFSETAVREVFSKVVNTLYNVLEFYQLFATEKVEVKKHSNNVLDKWILSKLHQLVTEVTEHMEHYRLAEAARPIVDFITELSQWYVRRSRDRFKGDDAEDKQHALNTLREVLETLAKIMAPFTPFIVEKVWYTVTGDKQSVHLQEWPTPKAEHHEPAILEQMTTARKIVEMGLALRAESKMKVRQPLAILLMNKENIHEDLRRIIADEMNVKVVDFAEAPGTDGFAAKEDGELKVWLDTRLTDELKAEGFLREIIRSINQMRKDQNLTIQDKVALAYMTDAKELKELIEKNADGIMAATLVTALTSGSCTGTAVEIDGKKLLLEIKK